VLGLERQVVERILTVSWVIILCQITANRAKTDLYFGRFVKNIFDVSGI
jgi:hypothetical protein